tara:strand:- start:394 stop:1104 length:711 start_codon:yes stop_codon:yes gene_type:complete
MKPTPNNIPRHVGIILDGNRRFAKKLMLKPWKGHEWGAKKIESLFEWAKELKIKELTLYTFSIYNFDRPKKEFDYLMDLFKKEFERIKDDKRIYNDEIKINFIGRIWMFPEEVQEKMRNLAEKTKHHNKHIVNFAMAYGGRAEVVDAVKIIAEKAKKSELNIDEINEKVFADHLYMNNDVDLIIRTSGEQRTSDFLPWQGNNAEWIFVQKTWPEFEKSDFLECIEEYKRRDRRMGK